MLKSPEKLEFSFVENGVECVMKFIRWGSCIISVVLLTENVVDVPITFNQIS